MVAPCLIGRGNVLGGEPQWRKAFGGESAEPVHALAVPGETVDADHLPQHLQGSGQLTFQVFVQRSSILHEAKVAQNSGEGQLSRPQCQDREHPKPGRHIGLVSACHAMVVRSMGVGLPSAASTCGQVLPPKPFVSTDDNTTGTPKTRAAFASATLL